MKFQFIVDIDISPEEGTAKSRNCFWTEIEPSLVSDSLAREVAKVASDSIVEGIEAWLESGKKEGAEVSASLPDTTAARRARGLYTQEEIGKMLAYFSAEDEFEELTGERPQPRKIQIQ